MMAVGCVNSLPFDACVTVTSVKAHTEPKADLNGDQVLVQRAKAGEVDAFRDLVLRYQTRAQAIAFGVIGRREDAEDIVQEAFLKAYRNLSSFRGQSSFYTWLYRIVFNLAVDVSRKRYRKVETGVSDNASLDTALWNARGKTDSLIAKVEDPESQLHRAELSIKINRAIEGLSAEHRAVIMLREIEGLSYAEISEVVGCSKGTVMSRLHHARKRLQQSLKEFVTWRISSKGQNEGEDFLSEEDELPNAEIRHRD